MTLPQSRFRRLLIALAVVGALAGAAWLVVLDRQVVRGFEAHLGREPAVVYASRLTLQPDQLISPATLDARLERLGFRQVDETPTQPGDYQWLDDTMLQLVTRPQDLVLSADADEPARAGRLVTLVFQEDQLTAIVSLQDSEAASAMLLGAEPLGVIAGPHRLSMQPVRPDEMPPVLLAAIFTMEDRRFWEHPGVDLRAIARALVVNLRAGRVIEGGSTLTQQLVKNLFLGHEQTLQRKAKEAVMALLLEAHYPKTAILEAYVNSIYFGPRAGAASGGAQAVIGVGEAADFYFGRPVAELSAAEQAQLVAMIKSPVRYAPGLFQTAGHAKERRDLVLERLEATGAISPPVAQAARATPVTASRRPTFMTGSAPYVVDWTQQLVAQEAVEEGWLTAATPGMRIVTTIDPDLQRAAESAVREGLAQLERSLPVAEAEPVQAALIAIDPRTGAVKALVGGRDYQLSQFNRAVQARRQPGSLFKPVVYLAALDRAGISPPPFTLASIIADEPITLLAGGQEWTPQNVDLIYHGPVTFRQVAESSLNAATVRIAATVGFDRVVEMARRTGASGDRTLPALPSVALGAIEASPLEMATVYATLANGGEQRAPRLIHLLVEPEEGVAMTWPQLQQPVAAASPEAAYLVTSLLSGVIDRGTGRFVRTLGFDRPAAGKTGTSSDLHDAWFAGYTPELVALVWVGYDQPRPLGLTGAQAALPIWTRFMQRALEPEPVSTFEPPEGVVERRIDPATGTLATWRCPDSVAEWFIAGTEPTELCQSQGPVGVAQGWFSRALRWFRN